jgi:hypothetical protein
MSEARVVIDLKEGVIELEGPIDFVRHYLEMYRPAIKRLSRLASANQETSKLLSRRRAAKGKRLSCTLAIQKEKKAGFFDSPHSVSDIKQRLNESGFEFKDNNVRTALKRLVNTGVLSANGKGQGFNVFEDWRIDLRKE